LGEEHVYEDVCGVGQDHDHTVEQQHEVQFVGAEHDDPIVEIALLVDCLVDQVRSAQYRHCRVALK
jgi:hypothetical protein